MVSRIDLRLALGASVFHLLVKLRGRNLNTIQHRDEMLHVGVCSAEDCLNVTDWQFLRLRLFVTGGFSSEEKTGAQGRVELHGNASNQDVGLMYASCAAMPW